MDKTRITNANKQHARRSAGAGEIKEINMDRDTIIDGLRMTMDLCVFDPSTGEEIEPHLLNDISRATYDACKGALEILKRLDTDSDTISRQAAIEAVMECYDNDELFEVYEEKLRELPPAQPERIKGRWISADAIFGGEPFYCSECGENTRDTVMGKPRWNFCPNCGADMRGEQDE